MDAFESFKMVGARFSRISVDERQVESGTGDEIGFDVNIECRHPALSTHTFRGRPVIELVVAAHASVTDEEPADPGELFYVECTAGFVGVEEKNDGNLELFADAQRAFSRAIFWLVRERIQSVFAVTMLRSHKKLPWDLFMEPSPSESTVEARGRVKKVSSAKKSAAKKSTAKRSLE